MLKLFVCYHESVKLLALLLSNKYIIALRCRLCDVSHFTKHEHAIKKMFGTIKAETFIPIFSAKYKKASE